MIVDGDELVFRACASTQSEIDWGDGCGPERFGSIYSACHLVDMYLQDAMEALEDTKVIIALSSSTNYRKDLHKDYKSNRTSEKPANYQDVIAWLWCAYSCLQYPGLEADDVMGLHEEHSIASSDKDMDTLPGRRRYSFYHKTTYEPKGVLEADRALFGQALSGDATDGYKGCPSIGKVKAARIVDACEDLADLEAALIDTFDSKGLGAPEALMNLRMARILRPGEYDLTTFTPILYTWKHV